MTDLFLMGNEAIARGLIEAGCTLASAYPGTPSTEIVQAVVNFRDLAIDPLHHLQVELVRRYREGKADERVQRGIHISINGIAAGLRNTG